MLWSEVSGSRDCTDLCEVDDPDWSAAATTADEVVVEMTGVPVVMVPVQLVGVGVGVGVFDLSVDEVETEEDC